MAKNASYQLAEQNIAKSLNLFYSICLSFCSVSKMIISRRKKSNCSSVPTVKLPSSAEKHARNRLGKKDTKNGVLASIILRKIIIYTKIRNTEYQKVVRASQLL